MKASNGRKVENIKKKAPKSIQKQRLQNNCTNKAPQIELSKCKI